MHRSLKELERYTVRASDGDVGSVANFLFDDEHWTIRYLVADTGGFFEGHRVLISPVSLRAADLLTRRLDVALTRDEIKESPTIDADKPVSRQHEQDYYRYYWGNARLWGVGAYPGLLVDGRGNDPMGDRTEALPDNPGVVATVSDVHLRSANEVRGYHLQGTDEDIGHVDDFIVDDETWQVQYLVIDTSNWWFGKKILLAPHWASRVSWHERKVHIDLSRGAIENSPEWNSSAVVIREYEARLYRYYGRPVYWGRATQPPPASASSR